LPPANPATLKLTPDFVNNRRSIGSIGHIHQRIVEGYLGQAITPRKKESISAFKFIPSIFNGPPGHSSSVFQYLLPSPRWHLWAKTKLLFCG
jgi:hypothetical protein